MATTPEMMSASDESPAPVRTGVCELYLIRHGRRRLSVQNLPTGSSRRAARRAGMGGRRRGRSALSPMGLAAVYAGRCAGRSTRR